MFLTALLLFALHAVRGSTDCNNVIRIGKLSHETEVLVNGLDIPYNLRVDEKRNNLYLNYNLNESSAEYFQLGVLNLENRTLTPIQGVKNGFVAAIHEDELYAGGSDGIYKFDEKNNKFVHTNITKDNIWSLMSIDNHIYFINYPALKLHKYVDNNVVSVEQYADIQVKQYAVTDNATVFYSNDTGLYMVNGNTKEETVLTTSVDVRAIALDKNQKAHFATEAGIFSETDDSLVTVITYVEFDIYGIVFDKDDNIIFASNSTVYKVKPRTEESIQNMKKCKLAEGAKEHN